MELKIVHNRQIIKNTEINMMQKGRDQICNFPESIIPQQKGSTFGQRTKIKRKQNQRPNLKIPKRFSQNRDQI